MFISFTQDNFVFCVIIVCAMRQIIRNLPDLLAALTAYIFVYRRYNKDGVKKLSIKTFLFFSILIILMTTLSPIVVSISNLFEKARGGYNFIPFIDWYYGYGHYALETVGNILLFIPFGMAWTLDKKCSSRFTVFCGALLSAFVEFIQPLLNPSRHCDITDLITNTAGAFIGACVILLVRKLRNHH